MYIGFSDLLPAVRQHAMSVPHVHKLGFEQTPQRILKACVCAFQVLHKLLRPTEVSLYALHSPIYPLNLPLHIVHEDELTLYSLAHGVSPSLLEDS